MEIKKITKADLADVIELIYQTSLIFGISHVISDNPKDKKLFASMFQESFNDMELFGYFEESKLLGVIGVEYNNYIPVLYVLKEYQHLNIGTKLLDYVKEYVLNKTTFIDVCADYKAIPFYEKNGFKISGDIMDNKVMMQYLVEKEKNHLK